MGEGGRERGREGKREGTPVEGALEALFVRELPLLVHNCAHTRNTDTQSSLF